MNKTASFYLKEIQRVSGLTQAEMATRLATTQLTVNAWIHDRSKPRQVAQQKIETLYFELLGNDEVDTSARDEKVEQALSLTFPIKQILKDQEKLNRLVVHFTYNTNSIEGSTMTYEDTRELLVEDNLLTNRSIIEQIEARNHQATFLWLPNSLSVNAVDFSHSFLQDIHLRLMNSIRSDAGTYRNQSVRIAGSRTVTANHASIKKKLDSLFAEMNNSSIKHKNAVAHIAQMHALFEQIHPFADGNGRVGRLLMLELAAKHSIMPPLITREKRAAYYKYLEMAQTKDRYTGLEYFIADAMIEMNEVVNPNSISQPWR